MYQGWKEGRKRCKPPNFLDSKNTIHSLLPLEFMKTVNTNNEWELDISIQLPPWKEKDITQYKIKKRGGC